MPATEHTHLSEQITGSFNTGALDVTGELVSPSLAGFTRDLALIRQALFASSLQRSDAPGTGVVAEAIRVTLQQLGTDGCTGRMAQEFGDHPEAATDRMRWVRSLLSWPEAITAVGWPKAVDSSDETELRRAS